MPAELSRLSVVAGFAIVLAVANSGQAASGPARYLKQPDSWFATAEAQQVAAHLLSHQADLGGWPKNMDTTAGVFRGDRQRELNPTFDNGATTDELRFLARICNADQRDEYRVAFEKGFAYILKAQYPTGGWPQFYPPGTKYHRHITFNDNAMVRLLLFLRETYSEPRYAFLAADRRQAARQAFDRGITCILKCQIAVDGRLTAWCAQHDERDYRPRPGRAYELVSISGAESVGIVRLLMSLDDPTPEVVRAIDAAVAWFQTAQLRGQKVVLVEDPDSPTGKDKRLVKDPAAPPLWARFYDIGTNQPIFCDRDGVAQRRLSDIGYERRNGYAWLGTWPQSLLDKEYPAWKKRLTQD